MGEVWLVTDVLVTWEEYYTNVEGTWIPVRNPFLPAVPRNHLLSRAYLS